MRTFFYFLFFIIFNFFFFFINSIFIVNIFNKFVYVESSEKNVNHQRILKDSLILLNKFNFFLLNYFLKIQL